MIDDFIKTVFYWELPKGLSQRAIFDYLFGTFNLYSTDNLIFLELLGYSPPQECPPSDIPLERWPFARLYIWSDCDCSLPQYPEDMRLVITFETIIRGKPFTFQKNWFANAGTMFAPSGFSSDFCCDGILVQEPQCYLQDGPNVTTSFYTILNLFNDIDTLATNYPDVTEIGDFTLNDLFVLDGSCVPFECPEDGSGYYESYVLNTNNEIVNLFIEPEGYEIDQVPVVGSNEWLELNGLSPPDVASISTISLEGEQGDLEYYSVSEVFLNDPPVDSRCFFAFRIYTKECNIEPSFDCEGKAPGWYITTSAFGIDLISRPFAPPIENMLTEALLNYLIPYIASLIPGVSISVDPLTGEISLFLTGFPIVQLQFELCPCPEGTSWNFRAKRCC